MNFLVLHFNGANLRKLFLHSLARSILLVETPIEKPFVVYLNGKINVYIKSRFKHEKKNAISRSTIRILQACNSHIARWLIEYFFYFLAFFFDPTQKAL